MAPSGKTFKPVKPAGRDIRLFFGGSQSGPSQITVNSSQGSKKAAASQTSKGLHKTEAIEISDDEKKPVPKKQIVSPAKVNVKPQKPKIKSMDVDDDDADEPPPLPKKPMKRKAIAALLSSDEDDDTPVTKKPAVAAASSSKPKPRTSIPTKPKPKPKARKDEDFIVTSGESDDDKPTRASATKAKSATKTNGKGKAKAEEKEEPKKQRYDWIAAKAAKLAGPVAHGSKSVPEPASPVCLSGLSFVFTGELGSFSREEAIDLAKRFGGRVVMQPSSKTDYVILGEGAGPSKIRAIEKHQIATLNEDEFLNLIATRKGPPLDEKTKQKLQKEKDVIKAAADEMAAREKAAQKQQSKASGNVKATDVGSQLWTTRYAPQSLKEICGNKGQVEKLQAWLHDWPTSLKSGFKKPGKHGMNMYRAVMITGSPGIGKTTSAHLVAKLEGFTPIELNASDARSKKLVENGMNISNKSLDGWIGGGEETNAAGITITDKSCLIMDEVDGMSAGDRGGVGALNALIKKSKIPIICIANDRGAQKLKPLLFTTFNLSFKKPEVNAVRSRILSIAYKEKMKVPANVIDQLISGAQSDIRQVLNMLSTWRLSSDTMDFDEGKDLAKANQKYSMMSPFDITNKMLGPYLFSSTARESLGDKMELYFQDHAFVPLFIQENYLKTQPTKVKNLAGPEQILKQLELMDRAASSISDGDLVDALIHGPEQHWSLMPLHAVCSAVRPASFLYGAGSGWGGPNQTTFPQWLGQNSKQAKLLRQLGDVQIRMRLKVSGDKPEIRQSYLPALFPHIVKPLMDVGASAVPEVIERMDEYYLSKEDWDTVVELGLDDHDGDLVMKQISTATKTALTRKYNASEHPIPFHKSEDSGKAPKKISGGAAPDIEDAFEMDEAVEDVSGDEKSSDDISKDKFIKPTKKKAVKGKAKK